MSNSNAFSRRSKKSTGASAIRIGRLLAITILFSALAALVLSAASASSSYKLDVSSKADGARAGEQGAGAFKLLARSESLSNPLFSTMTPPLDDPEVVATYAPGCATPKTAFVLGDQVCVKTSGGPDLSSFARRLAIVDPSSIIRNTTALTTDPQTTTFTIPSTQTTVVAGETIDNRGVWKANIVPGGRFSPRASASFTVSDPDNPKANIAIYLNDDSGGSTTAGSNVLFSLWITNTGPDDATNFQVSNAIPANTTFLSGQQDSGPDLSCTFPLALATTGGLTCGPVTFPAGAKARITFIVNVNTGTASGTTITDTGSVSSDTPDPEMVDNSASSSTLLIPGAASGCTLECPENITAIANTEESSVRGAHVSFDTPEGVGTCGAITATPVSGSFFPVGPTVVSFTSETGGGACSFTITIIDNGSNPPTISCPANKTVNADANCAASVVLGTPTTGGANVTVVGSRSDGAAMYDCDVNGENCVRKATDLPFSAGVTTVTWIAYSHDTPGPYANNDAEEAHRTGAALCTQTVTVNDVTPPTITSPSPTVSADANCQAAVPDFSTIASVSDNCACASSDTSQICDSQHDIVITQDVAPGTMVGLGPHTITLTANDGSSNNNGAGNSTSVQVTLTVVDTTAPTFTFVPPTVIAYTGPGATTCDTVISGATLGTATATDNCSAVTITRTPSGNTFPVGNTTVVWKATDAAGNLSTANQTVTVIDNTAPTITLNGNTPSMWPPNHKYQTFSVTNFVTSVFDNCGGVSVNGVVIDHVTSDETENGNGDGNTTNDIVIASNCKSVQLRSERDGGGDGRVYTITFRLTDTHGNVTTATVKVVVQHNPGETPVDSGVHYTVNGSCP